MLVTVVTAAERPDPLERAWTVTRDTLTEFNNHGVVTGRPMNCPPGSTARSRGVSTSPRTRWARSWSRRESIRAAACTPSRFRRWRRARAHGFSALIAPVPPSWKERYAAVPIARYAVWRRANGLPVNPWLPVHERLGTEMLRPEPRSLHITGAVAEREAWTGLACPDSGEYVFPGGLAPLAIDQEAQQGA